jgi:hypothetical protein
VPVSQRRRLLSDLNDRARLNHQNPHLSGVVVACGHGSSCRTLKSAGARGGRNRQYVSVAGSQSCDMENQVLTRSANGVGRLTFNRPEHRNAMSPQMLEKPVIAAIRGYSIGAGLSFVLAADFAVTAFTERRQAKFGRWS